MGMDAEAWIGQRNAAGVAGASQLVGAGSGTYSIESRARLADGRQAAISTVVRAGASPVPGSAYTLLRWEEGASPQ
jgi:general secretion pathway protein K